MTVGQLKVIIGADAGKALAAFRAVDKATGDLSGRLAGYSAKFAALTAAVAAGAGASIAAWDKQAGAIAKVENGIQSTGGAAGRTLEQLEKQASALQGVSLFGDEDILNDVTAQVLTFTNIAGEQFDRTQQAALDLATKLDGDLKGAAIQLGKALNDPAANLSALSRSGIQFSEDQKAVIKSLQETGRLAEAQTIILDELERQYGGTAQAAAEAGAGGLKQLKKEAGDLLEQFGELAYEGIRPLVGWLRKGIKWFQELSPEVKKNVGVLALLVGGIAPVLAGLSAVVAIAPAVAAAWALLTGPVGLVIAGLTALGVLIYANRKKLHEWGLVVKSFAQRIYSQFLGSVKAAVDALAGFLGFIGKVDPIARAASNGLKRFSDKLGEAQASAEIDLSTTVGELDRVRAAADGARSAVQDYGQAMGDVSGLTLGDIVLPSAAPDTSPTFTPTATPTATPAPETKRTVADVLSELRADLKRIPGDVQAGLVKPLDQAATRAGLIESAIAEARRLGAAPGALSALTADLRAARADAERIEKLRASEGRVKPIASTRGAVRDPISDAGLTKLERARALTSEFSGLIADVPFRDLTSGLVSMGAVGVAALAALQQGVRDTVDGLAYGLGDVATSTIGAAFGALGLGMGQTRERIAELEAELARGDLGEEQATRARRELEKMRALMNPLKVAWKSFGSLVTEVLRRLVADLVSAIAKAAILGAIKAAIGVSTGGVGGFIGTALGISPASAATPALAITSSTVSGSGVAPAAFGRALLAIEQTQREVASIKQAQPVVAVDGYTSRRIDASAAKARSGVPRRYRIEHS